MDDISMNLEVEAEDVETTWEVEPPVIERDFKETLTKEQLLGLINDRKKPDHWQDGVVSYFRVHKIIEMLRKENLPMKPNFDVALEVLSDGKAKYHNQSHKNICKYIKFQVEHQEDLAVEELQGPVERLVPGCFPIGPECESLGITGDVLVSEEVTFPEPFDPKRMTNRVLFELGQYVARIRQRHKDMAVWVRKILGVSGEENLTGEMVSRWCNLLSNKTNQKKATSMSLAQQYLEEQFTFPGLDLSKCLAHKTDKAEAQHPEPSSAKETEEAKSDRTSTRETGKANGYMENDNDVEMDVNILDQTPDSRSTDIADATDPDEKIDTNNTSQNSPRDENNGNYSTSPSKEKTESIDGKDSTEDKLATEDKMNSDSEATPSDNTQTPSIAERKSTRASASVAKEKLNTSKTNNTTVKEEVVRKPVQKKVKTVKITKPTKGKKSGQKKGAKEGTDDEEEEEDDDTDSEEEDEEESPKGPLRSSSSGDTNSVGRNLIEAAKRLESVFTRIKNLKKEMKIAIDYLEDESKKVKKELDGVKRQICKSKMSLSGGKKTQKIESEDEEEDAEDTNEEEDEVDREDETPKSKRGRPPKTKKITVQVPQGVTKRLRKPVLHLTPLTCGNAEPSESETGESDAESELQEDSSSLGRKTPSRRSKTSTPKPRSKLGKAIREVSSEDEQRFSPSKRSKPSLQSSKSPVTQKLSRREGKDTRGKLTCAKAVPVRGKTRSPAKAGPASRSNRSVSEDKSELSSDKIDFDKNKLFASTVCVSLVKLDVDSVGGLDDLSSSDDDKPIKPKAGHYKTPTRGSKQQISSKQSTKSNKNVLNVSSEKETGRSLRSNRATARMGSPEQKAVIKDSKPKGKKRQERSAESQTEKKFNESDSRSGRAKSKQLLVTSDEKSDDGRESDLSGPSPPRKSARSLRQEKKSKPADKGRDDDCDDEEDSPVSGRGTRTSSRAGTKKTASRHVLHSDASSDDCKVGDHKSQGKAQKSSAHAAAAKSAPGEWRGASKTERGKKRSLNDFVKSLNSPKRFKDESGKRSSPRKADGSGGSGSGFVQPATSDDELHFVSEEEFGDDDFLEKATKLQLEEREREEREKKEKEKSKELHDEQSNEADTNSKEGDGDKEEEEDEKDDDDDDDGDDKDDKEEDDNDDSKENDDEGEDKKSDDDVKEDESDGNQKEDGKGYQNDNSEFSEESEMDDKDVDGDGRGQQDAPSENTIATEEETSMTLHLSREENAVQRNATWEEDKNKDTAEDETSKTTSEEVLGGAEWSEVLGEGGKLSTEEPMETEDTVQVNGNHDPHDNHVGEEPSQNGKMVEEDDPEMDEFPGDSIIGQRIRHRRCSGHHGLYKWYEGEVLGKASSAELLKLDEAQFSHLNNLKTIYTIQYKDSPQLSHLALEVDWDEGNVKIVS